MLWEAIVVIAIFFVIGFQIGMIYQHICWVKELKR